MKGPLSNNLDAIGRSEARRLIQDRNLEHQFFELIINLTGLRPVAKDDLEAEDLLFFEKRAAERALSCLSCSIWASDLAFSDSKAST